MTPGKRHKFRVALTALLFVLEFAVLVPSARARKAPSSPDLPIEVRMADPELAAETVKILRAAHREMAGASGIRLTDTLHVVYVGRDQTFDSLAGGLFPDWGVGVAVADKNLIAIRSPREYPIHDQLRLILRHELAHLHFAAILGGRRRPPRWMNEGYAQQFAHQWNYGDDWTIARAVFAGHLLPLRDIDGVNSFRDAKARLAYAESYLAMGYFLDTYGWDGLMLIARTMRQGGTWDEAFSEATGADYAAFQREYLSYLKDRYNWAVFLSDTALLWVLLVIAFVVLYFIKRHRSAVRLAGWRRQEDLEDIFYARFEGFDDSHPRTQAIDNMPTQPVRQRLPLRFRVEYALALAMRALAGILPERWSRKAGAAVGGLVGMLWRSRRKIARRNLELAFDGRFSPGEIKAVTDDVFRNMGRTVFEVLRFAHTDPRSLLERVDYSGDDFFHRVMEKGTGAILVSGHFGNWEILAAWICALGYPVDAIVKPMRNPLVDRLYNDCRAAMNLRVIHTQVATKGIIRALQQKRFVAIVADQYAGPEGVEVDFFGRPASTPRGPAALALKFGYPLLTGVLERLPGGRFRAHLDGPIEYRPTGDNTEDIRALTQELTARLEAHIRRTPGQWLWTHRRWRD